MLANWKILVLFLMLFSQQHLTAMSFPIGTWGYDLKARGLGFMVDGEESGPIEVKVSGKLALCHHMDRGHIILEVSGGTPPYDFTWNNHDKTQNRYNLFSGTYTVFIKDANGQRHEERIVIQPPFPLIIEMDEIGPASCSGTADGKAKLNIRFGGGESYKIIWSHGLEDELEATELLPGDYTVRVINIHNCEATLSFEIKSNAESFEVKEEISPISCKDGVLGSIVLDVSGGAAPYTFIWSNGQSTKDLHDLEQGVYEVMIKDQLGCTFTKSFEIQSPEAVEVTVARVQHNQCFGADEGEIDIEVKGGVPPYTFLWSNGAQTQQLRGLKEGIYTLEVRDALGCTIESKIEIEQPEAFSARIETALDLDCESGEAIGFAWVSIQGGNAPYTIHWGNGEEGKQEIEFRESGEITVEIFDNTGCKVSEKVRVSFPFDHSIANRLDFNVKKLSISSEKEVHVLEPLVFESEIAEDFIAWEWDFGDGSKTMEKDPVHVFKNSGAYFVTLRAYDIYGCSSLQSRTVTVLEQEEWVTVPNAFTPNGDGLNDVFQPVVKGLTHFEMDIFNHWGEHLFASKGLEISGWDGTFKGSLLPRGNYVYKIQYSTISGETVQKTGTITLVR